jgi:hypothetical protein
MTTQHPGGGAGTAGPAAGAAAGAAAAAGTAEDAGLGGEPACWAHLVCPECGAMESEGHAAACPARAAG